MTIEKEDGRTYDRFRDRVMFPIRNVKGQVIAFWWSSFRRRKT